MPYIGKNPVGGGFHKLDSLTASATATYALTLGSAAYYPESANQLLVSLNGVIQAPQDSFTVSGSNLVFDTALTSSDSIDFVVALGDVLAVQTVTDGAITANKIGTDAVTTAKIQDGAVTAAKMSSGLNVTGNVLEQLSMLCDGQNYTVSSGTYTSENVTAKQELTTSYVDITGSTISYTPPTGTVCVVYEFCFAASFVDAFQIGHYKFFIDSDEVVYQRRNLGGDGQQTFYTLRSVIPIGGTADTNTGRQSSWTSAKTLKMQAREYSSVYEGNLHTSYYWDGAVSEQFHIPSLTITALGD